MPTPMPATVPTPTPAPSPPPADPHAGHDMSQMPAPPTPPAPPMDGMDHSAMGHDTPVDPSPGPTMETPPPVEAGSGPPRAADAIWGADEMAASRRDLQATHGDFPVFWLQADRAEVQVRDGADGYLWDVQGYYGGTTSRFWFKSEGEGNFGELVEDAEVQALYSRAITPFFDLQAGVRQDIAGPGTTYAVFGIQGVAPYMFEVDSALFLSHRGDLTARIEGELDQRITQSLILQPRAEITLSAQDIPQLGIGAGVDNIEIGVRLRYEIRREFAPYVGIEQCWRVGRSADFARAAGEDTRTTSFVIGVRFWF
jgi:copper resistance protein B